MRVSQLRQLLNRKVGEEQLEFRIPQIFLPPRFRDLSEGRDLLLLLDADLTLHLRWYGEDFHTHYPLTPGAVRRLVREVMKYLKEYRESLKVFGAYVDEHSEEPLDEERYHDGFREEEETPQGAEKNRPKEEKEHETERQEEEPGEVGRTLCAEVRSLDDLIADLDTFEAGGESPCPDVGY